MMWTKEKKSNLNYPESGEMKRSKGAQIYDRCQWAAIIIMFLLIVFAPQVQSLYIKEIPLDNRTIEGLMHTCYSSVIYIEGDAYALNEGHELHGVRALLEGSRTGKILFLRGEGIFEKAKESGVWGISYDENFEEVCQYALYKDKVYLLIDGVYYKEALVQSKPMFKESLKHIEDGTTYEWVKGMLERSK